MIAPDFSEFKEKTKKGNLIPVYKEILADVDTPVSAYLKVRHGDYSFLLESIEGGEKWARYSFLGCDPEIILMSRGDEIIEVRRGEKHVKKVAHGKPLTELREMLAKIHPVEDENLPRFFGGAVGFISYDMVRYFENLPDKSDGDLGLYDSVFIITDTLLIFDNVRHTIKIVSNAFIEDGDDLEAEYQSTLDKIDNLEKKLKNPLPGTSTYDLGSSDDLSDTVFESSFSKPGFEDAVRKVKEYIREGDAIQVVLSQRLECPFEQDPFTVYRALRKINPSPYMYYLNFGEMQVVGSSPEILVRLEDRDVQVRPIAGTRKRGKNEEEDLFLEKELLADEKENAEHVMLVDLGRNDVGRVADYETVRLTQERVVERYSHVMHIVSNVTGRLKDGLDWYDVLAATFPAGTVSGAPKVRAMEIIDEMEPNRRGLYAGSVGYISFNGNMDTAIAIRTLVFLNKKAYLGVGAGIVADSVPESEFEETMNKGKALIKAIDLAKRGLDP